MRIVKLAISYLYVSCHHLADDVQLIAVFAQTACALTTNQLIAEISSGWLNRVVRNHNYLIYLKAPDSIVKQLYHEIEYCQVLSTCLIINARKRKVPYTITLVVNTWIVCFLLSNMLWLWVRRNWNRLTFFRLIYIFRTGNSESVLFRFKITSRNWF